MAGYYRNRHFLDMVLGMDGTRDSVSGFFCIPFNGNAHNYLHHYITDGYIHKDSAWRPFVGMARRKTSKTTVMVQSAIEVFPLIRCIS